MITVEIYSKQQCHLCDVAKDVLKRIQLSHPFVLKEILIHEGDEYYERYKERIPVITINNEFAFQYRVHAEELLARLNAEEQKAQRA